VSSLTQASHNHLSAKLYEVVAAPAKKPPGKPVLGTPRICHCQRRLICPNKHAAIVRVTVYRVTAWMAWTKVLHVYKDHKRTMRAGIKNRKCESFTFAACLRADLNHFRVIVDQLRLVWASRSTGRQRPARASSIIPQLDMTSPGRASTAPSSY
jgi:hypothetical protein